jgi:hypothetical protein
MKSNQGGRQTTQHKQQKEHNTTKATTTRKTKRNRQQRRKGKAPTQQKKKEQQTHNPKKPNPLFQLTLKSSQFPRRICSRHLLAMSALVDFHLLVGGRGRLREVLNTDYRRPCTRKIYLGIRSFETAPVALSKSLYLLFHFHWAEEFHRKPRSFASELRRALGADSGKYGIRETRKHIIAEQDRHHIQAAVKSVQLLLV